MRYAEGPHHGDPKVRASSGLQSLWARVARVVFAPAEWEWATSAAGTTLALMKGFGRANVASIAANCRSAIDCAIRRAADGARAPNTGRPRAARSSHHASRHHRCSGHHQSKASGNPTQSSQEASPREVFFLQI